MTEQRVAQQYDVFSAGRILYFFALAKTPSDLWGNPTFASNSTPVLPRKLSADFPETIDLELFELAMRMQETSPLTRKNMQGYAEEARALYESAQKK